MATIYKHADYTGVEFGLTDETGIALNSFTRNVTSTKGELKDADGEVVAVAFTATMAEITLEGTLNGSVTMEVGALLTLLNDVSKYGLEGGTILVNSIEEKSTSGAFKTISISATQYANTMTV